MIADGTCIWVRDHNLTIRTGYAIVDEPNNRLLFMEMWATGTGYAHLMNWERFEDGGNHINFYDHTGLAFSLLPFDECVGLDQNLLQESLTAWRIETEGQRR